MSKTCPDCGCRVYSNGCVHCHEENYIAEQYAELDMPMSDEFKSLVEEKQDDYLYKQQNGYYDHE